ncbi:hypothetical protein E5D57_006072 [Metarhizium anisopliae]|nr:hypothetical protein E5D57_006072 [Metarhizium anisopliae]
MVLVHIVLFKFKPSVSPAHKEAFAAELKRLRDLPSVLNKRLVVGGPSVTDPIARSRGNHLALVSYHASKAALAEYVFILRKQMNTSGGLKRLTCMSRYQASDEHHRQGGMADSTLGVVS